VNRFRIALDGHDGSGKSTMAARLADELGARLVKPFADTLGDHIAWLWGRSQFTDADRLARASIDRFESLHADESVVFDRHWLTMFTVLPEAYWSGWRNRPRTVVFATDPATTMRRLGARGEDPLSAELHKYYERMYREIAARFNVPVVDTTDSSIENTFEIVLTYALEGRPI